MIYKYHGDIFSVYDQQNNGGDKDTGEDVGRFTDDALYNQAMKNKATGELPKTVVDYLNYKIIDIADSENKRYVKQNFVDWNWNYTLKDFPKQEEY